MEGSKSFLPAQAFKIFDKAQDTFTTQGCRKLL